MSIKSRLEMLEDGTQPAAVDAHERERLRVSIRESAEQSIDCSRRERTKPVFEITEEGNVLCTHDGRPVLTCKQCLSEELYRHYLAIGIRGYDEETETFRMPEGRFAFSRKDFDFAQVFRLASKEVS